MYLYFFQLQAFGSGVDLTSLCRNKQNPVNKCKFNSLRALLWIEFCFLKLTTRFLLQVLDSAGELGWQLERAGLSGDGIGVPMRGDSGSPFIAFDLGWQVGKAPGLREPPTSAGTLQAKQRKCCNELNLTTDKGMQTKAATRVNTNPER